MKKTCNHFDLPVGPLRMKTAPMRQPSIPSSGSSTNFLAPGIVKRGTHCNRYLPLLGRGTKRRAVSHEGKEKALWRSKVLDLGEWRGEWQVCYRTVFITLCWTALQNEREGAEVPSIVLTRETQHEDDQQPSDDDSLHETEST